MLMVILSMGGREYPCRLAGPMNAIRNVCNAVSDLLDLQAVDQVDAISMAGSNTSTTQGACMTCCATDMACLQEAGRHTLAILSSITVLVTFLPLRNSFSNLGKLVSNKAALLRLSPAKSCVM